MVARRFAEDTAVPIERSRQEITALLREWDCTSITWGDNFELGAAALGFTWRYEGQPYAVRFRLTMPTREQLEKEALELWPNQWHQGQKRSRAAYVERVLKNAPRAYHRLLLVKLKADLNAARAGLAKAEEIFLPWIIDQNGRTIGEIMLPQISSFAALPPKGGTGEGHG
jgi:hypothetical protein